MTYFGGKNTFCLCIVGHNLKTQCVYHKVLEDTWIHHDFKRFPTAALLDMRCKGQNARVAVQAPFLTNSSLGTARSPLEASS